MAGDEWTWPTGRRTRPPGSRLPDTPVTTHATYTLGGHQFALVSFTDSEGGKCVAVDQDGQPGSSVCDVEVSSNLTEGQLRHLVPRRPVRQELAAARLG
jgi:hypothetical protein